MTVLITGGASGLGEAITKRFALDPACMVYFTFNNSKDKAKQIESEFSNCKGIKCDFKNDTDIQNLLDRIAEMKLNVLINNAYSGSFIATHFHKTPHQHFLEAFETNIIPTIRITQEAIGNFKKEKQGTIITILTEALNQTPPIGSSVYTTTKAYLQELVKVWATENSKFNIRSTSISPGFMETNFTKEMDDRTVDQMRDRTPSKKFQTTKEVAESIFLLTKGI